VDSLDQLAAVLAKKILEWSRSAAEAYDVCVRMNDRRELDSRAYIEKWNA
jgi:hypothetical protein